nr:hypothetical protein GTC16762_21650 [Pigmentibacter ruber]
MVKVLICKMYNNNIHENIKDLLKNLRECCQEIVDSMGYHKTVEAQGIRAILLAPEYFLSKSAGKKIITRDEKIFIEKEIIEISKSYKKILLIPGTISWKRNIIPKWLNDLHTDYQEYKNCIQQNKNYSQKNNINLNKTKAIQKVKDNKNVKVKVEFKDEDLLFSDLLN